MLIISKNYVASGHEVLLDKYKTQLSANNNDSFDHGSINEDGQGKTKDEDAEEVVEYCIT